MVKLHSMLHVFVHSDVMQARFGGVPAMNTFNVIIHSRNNYDH